MAYDFTTLPDRWDAGAFKYLEMQKKKPDVSRDAVPLSVADMEFLDPPQVVEGLKDYLDHNVLGYTGPTDAYFAAVQSWMERRHGFRPKKDWFITSPGIVPALFELVKALTVPGDGVLMLSPVYHPFRFCAQEQGREAIFCPLIERERTYDIDFELFEKLCAQPRVKLFLLCSPHNPVGRIWTRDELLRLSDICLKHGVLMVADEIHGDLILPGYTFVSVGTLPEQYVKNAILCTAPSKTFNLAGMQCSNLFVADEGLRAKVKKEGHYPTLTALGYESCRLAYDRAEPWLDELLTVLGENKKLTEAYLAQNVPEIKPFELMGTYLMWLDCRALGLHKDGLEKAMIDGELFFDEGYIFGEEGAGFERLNLACPTWVLQKALDKLAAVVRRVQK
ncbi:MAG: pyridoxal phosphate-dependent aminotransferase [Clostridia bacterium]|nr:pyridoxal phosphate-dependent aminotransferase [Clostridia bacterium]